MKKDPDAELIDRQLCIMKQRFMQRVYYMGLYEALRVSSGYDIAFAEVRLCSHINRDGYVICEFTSEADGIEKSLVIKVEDGDTKGDSAAVKSVCASLPECVAMMQQVIDNWPRNTSDQSHLANGHLCTVLPFSASKKGE